MKTAKLEIAAFWVSCAYCGEAIENEDGSFIFRKADYHKEEDLKITCFECKRENKLPKKLLY